MDKETENKTEEKTDQLITKGGPEEHEENLSRKSSKKIEEVIEDQNDDFQGYSTIAKYQLFLLFFLLGIINHLGTILVMTGGRLLAFELEMKDYLTIYTSVSPIFSVFTRLINSKLCLKVSYKKRVIFNCVWMMAGYLSMFAVLQLHDTILEEYNVLCFVLSFIPCFFLGSSYAFGESAMIAYLRLFPKTLIAGWSSGTGLSGLISGFLNFLSQYLNGLSLKFLYLILTPTGLLYLLLFMWTYRILKSQERKIEKRRRLSSMENISLPRNTSIRNTDIEEVKKKIEDENNENNENNENQENNEKNENDENNEKENENGNEELEVKNKNEEQEEKEKKEELNKQLYEQQNLEIEEEEKEEDIKSIREAEDKEMEEMNKSNQVMSFTNFLKVMNMVGEVIINLGLIYFLQFFCENCLVVRVCDKIDIPFLPIGCSDNHHPYRKGKFEFINLSYQVGMFTAKTFIKLVRKIQPIEVYTIAIAIINIIYIVEYYANYLIWQVLLVFGLILGFFSGGTYSGGFYTILNSNRVDKNYKELTVNVATIFNDSGTFLSGIAGFIALNYWINNSDAFDDQKIEPIKC